MQTLKANLRREVKQKVKNFTPEYLSSSDEQITNSLLAMPEFSAATMMFIYISVGREPHTHTMIETALQKGKRVCVPLCLGDGIMQAREIFSLNALQKTSMGLLEPAQDAPIVPLNEIDFIVAPCVATDKKGMRLGRGGGYYDRFLKKTKAPLVCICREALMYEQLPFDEMDVPLPMILTEEKLYHF